MHNAHCVAIGNTLHAYGFCCMYYVYYVYNVNIIYTFWYIKKEQFVLIL